MIKAFILLAILIGGQAVVQESHAQELPEQVSLIYSGQHIIDVKAASFKEYLRHTDLLLVMPATIHYELDCYSDGSGTLRPTKNYRELLFLLSHDGESELKSSLVEIAEYQCTIQWSKVYGSTDGESEPTWYL